MKWTVSSNAEGRARGVSCRVMPESTFTWLALCAYALLMVAAGFSAKRARTFQVFAIGERSRRPLLVGMAAAAGAVSSTTFVINPGLVWLYGYSAFVAIALSSTAGFLFGMVVFSKSFRRIGERFEALTVAQWVGDRFRSPGLRFFFGCISLLQVAYVVLIVVSLAQVIAKGLSVPVVPAAVFVVLFTCAYIFFGGTSTHILTNTIQAVVMTVVALLLIFSGAGHFADGLPTFFDKLRLVGPYYADSVNPASDLYRDFYETIVAQFVIGAVSALLPHLIVKSLYLRDEREVNTYLVSASTFVVLFKMVLVTGFYARLELGMVEGMTPDNVMATYFVTHYSPLVRAVVTLGVLAAGFSTLEAIILALASIFSHDVARPALHRLFGKVVDELQLARFFFVLLIPVVSVLAFRQIVAPSLSVIIFAFNGILAFTAAVVPSIAFGIYSKSQSVRAGFASALAALAVFYSILGFEISRYHTNPMIPGTLGVLVGLVVFGLVAAVDRRAGTRA
jgi:sodium/pantothenate symporter